jgi:hypothetical protein
MQHAWRGLFISLRWESNLTAADRVSSSTSEGHVLRRGRRGALIDPQTSLLGIGTNLSRASGWSRVGTRPTSTASCQQKQTTTMTNSVSPAPWLLRDRFPVYSIRRAARYDSHQDVLDLPAIRPDPSFPPASTTNVTPLDDVDVFRIPVQLVRLSLCVYMHLTVSGNSQGCMVHSQCLMS